MVQTVDFLYVLDAIMDNAFYLVIAIVFMGGMEIIVQHVNLCQDVKMEDVLINPIIVNVNQDGKAYFVMNLFASLHVILELVLILMIKLETSVFVKKAGKDQIVTNAFLIGNAQTKKLILAGCQGSAIVQRT